MKNYCELPVPPNVFVVQDANLMQLPSAVDTHHERLQIEQVVLLLVEVLLFDVTRRRGKTD